MVLNLLWVRFLLWLSLAALSATSLSACNLGERGRGSRGGTEEAGSSGVERGEGDLDGGGGSNGSDAAGATGSSGTGGVADAGGAGRVAESGSTGGVAESGSTGGVAESGGTGGVAESGGTGGVAGSGGTGGVAGSGGTGGVADAGGTGGVADAGGTGGVAGSGGTGGVACCADGNCICRDEPPAELTSDDGPYSYEQYQLGDLGCVYYPMDAEPPFSAVAFSDFLYGTATAGCSYTLSRWGGFLASHGIVTIAIIVTSDDQPPERGQKLGAGVEGLRAENENSESALFGKLAGRYGTVGFSMGGGGTTYASAADPTLRSSLAIMPWGPTDAEVTVPTLVICGSRDGTAPCSSHGTPFYERMSDSVPKMRVTIASGHAGQPSSGSRMAGAWGLAFQKLFLDGDERWRAVLLSGSADATNIR